MNFVTGDRIIDSQQSHIRFHCPVIFKPQFYEPFSKKSPESWKWIDRISAMNPSYSVSYLITGWQLKQKTRDYLTALADYHDFLILNSTTPSEIASIPEHGIAFLNSPDMDERSLRELTATATVIPVSERSLSNYRLFYDAGIAAVWEWTESPDNLTFHMFPEIPGAKDETREHQSHKSGSNPEIQQEDSSCRSKQTVFLVTQNNPVKRQLRQIFEMSGRVPRMDFHSTEDALLVLRNSPPDMIVIDLDSETVDPIHFFYEMDRLLKGKKAPRILAMKDFSRPGMDPATMKLTFRKHVKRIFHPLEVSLALIEGLFLYQGEQSPARPVRRAAFRSLSTITGGPTGPVPSWHPLEFFERFDMEWSAMRKTMLFHWLYTLHRHAPSYGLSLSP